MSASCLPEIPKVKQRVNKGISFAIARPTPIPPSNAFKVANNDETGKNVKDREATTFTDTSDEANCQGTNSVEKKQFSSFAVSSKSTKNERKLVDCLQETRLSKRSLLPTGFGISERDDLRLENLLREKDREISRLREIIHKLSLDRESAVSKNANSRMRVVELKDKLLSQHERVEHVTMVERLRSKQRVSSETERLRHERDEARAQLARHEKLAWQLKKRVGQLEYACQQKHKTIQEQTKKLATKDKNLQDMRKRMEQAQLIPVSGSISIERRMSMIDVSRSLTSEGAGRLPKVNE